ncbi:MAG: PA2779 family protein [bacterium]|nr:PA2779 family protein [bacterium]
MIRSILNRLCCVTTALVFYTAMIPQPARAEIITTKAFAQSHFSANPRTRINELLARNDVQSELMRYGVSSVEAKSRIDALSDSEVKDLALNFDKQIAAGDGLGTVIGAIILVFVVLLLTDILGLTKVFPFTRSVR